MEVERAAAQHAGIAAFARQRKEDSRSRMLAAALDLFSASGYPEVTVEDILRRADVSRPTFYRHFAGKAELAVVLYETLVAEGAPRRLAIRDADWRDSAVVAGWIRSIFEADQAEKRLHKVFSQGVIESPVLARSARDTITAMIAGLGERIPAFEAADENADRRRWLQAYLVLFEILDQSSHAALKTGVANDPLITDLLTERFISFCET